MKRDESSYGSVSRKFDEYVDFMERKPAPPARGLPPQRPYVPEPEDRDLGRTVFSAIGFGIALILLILAVVAFVTAAKWGGLNRDGAAVGYTLVGFFLTIAALGGGLATYNHNFRVLTRPAGHHD